MHEADEHEADEHEADVDRCAASMHEADEHEAAPLDARGRRARAPSSPHRELGTRSMSSTRAASSTRAVCRGS
jgi:hypothetical protein